MERPGVTPEHHVLPVPVLVELPCQPGDRSADQALEGDGRVQQDAASAQAVAEVEVEILVAHEALVEAADGPGPVDAVQAVGQVVDVGRAGRVVVPGVADAES